MKDCTLWEGLRWRILWRTVPHGRDPPRWSRGRVRSEQGAAETTCDELTTAPIPCPPAALGGEEGENSEVRLSPGRREG